MFSVLHVVYGLEHHRSLEIRAQYASSLLRQRRTKESEHLSREILPIMRRVLGKHHEATMACITNMATAISLQDRVVEAELLYSELLVAQERVLGKLHPQTVDTLHRVISCLSHRCNAERRVQRLRHDKERDSDIHIALRENELARMRMSLKRGHRGLRNEKLHQSRIADMITKRRLVAARGFRSKYGRDYNNHVYDTSAKCTRLETFIVANKKVALRTSVHRLRKTSKRKV